MKLSVKVLESQHNDYAASQDNAEIETDSMEDTNNSNCSSEVNSTNNITQSLYKGPNSDDSDSEADSDIQEEQIIYDSDS